MSVCSGGGRGDGSSQCRPTSWERRRVRMWEEILIPKAEVWEGLVLEGGRCLQGWVGEGSD